MQFPLKESRAVLEQLVDISVLGGAIAASLTFGVVGARFLCHSAFLLIRLHATSVANERLEKASAPAS